MGKPVFPVHVLRCYVHFNTMNWKVWSRKKAASINSIGLSFLSLTCIFGFHLLSELQPLGEGSTILDLEDFILSNNLLPLGSLVFLLFCTRRYGREWDNFYQEACIGKGLNYPKSTRKCISYILPIIVLIIFAGGYLT